MFWGSIARRRAHEIRASYMSNRHLVVTSANKIRFHILPLLFGLANVFLTPFTVQAASKQLAHMHEAMADATAANDQFKAEAEKIADTFNNWNVETAPGHPAIDGSAAQAKTAELHAGLDEKVNAAKEREAARLAQEEQQRKELEAKKAAAAYQQQQAAARQAQMQAAAEAAQRAAAAQQAAVAAAQQAQMDAARAAQDSALGR